MPLLITSVARRVEISMDNSLWWVRLSLEEADYGRLLAQCITLRLLRLGWGTPLAPANSAISSRSLLNFDPSSARDFPNFDRALTQTNPYQLSHVCLRPSQIISPAWSMLSLPQNPSARRHARQAGGTHTEERTKNRQIGTFKACLRRLGSFQDQVSMLEHL